MSLTLFLLALAVADPQAQDAPPPTAPSTPPAKPQDGTVSGVTVSGARAPVETSIDRRSYSVANDLLATTGSIADVLRDIPSVQVDLDGNLSLRGANVTILVDGKPSTQFSGENQAQALQSLPASQIDRIEVMTNPSAEFRADGSGGIINLITKKARGAGKTGSVRIQAATGPNAALSGTAGYNSDRLSVTTDASYRYDHGTATAVVQQGTPNPVTGLINTSQDNISIPSFQDVATGHVGADYDLDAKTRLSGSLRFTYTHIDNPGDDSFVQDGDTGSPNAGFDRDTRQTITGYNGEASVILRHKYAEGNDLTLNVTYSGNQGAVDRVDDITPTLPAASPTADEVFRENFNHRPRFTADYERPVGAAKLKLGYDLEYSDSLAEHRGGFGALGAIAPDPSQTDNFTDVETHNQAYVTYDRAFGKLDALFGLRGETTHLALDEQTQGLRSSQAYSRVYPTLHLAYDLSDGRRLVASYSRRIDRPFPGDLDPFPHPSSVGEVFQGNPDLKPEDTSSYELGYEARKDAKSFLATLYYRQTNDAFSLVDTPLGGGGLLEQIQNVGKWTDAGLELVMANKLTPKLTYNLSVDAYWGQISAANLGFTQTQSVFTGFGRANLNWQVTAKDFLQFNVFVNGERLQTQGHAEPTISGNFGYRHTINSKMAWMFVVQDPFHSLKSRLKLDTAHGTDQRLSETNSRTASLTLVWNFAGKPAATNFDFTPGGGG